MSEAKDRGGTQQGKWPAQVAHVLSRTRFVINRGAQHDVRLGQRFLLYDVSDEEIFDPVTNESLGYLEIPKGTGVVIHAQPSIATIQSDTFDDSLGHFPPTMRRRKDFSGLEEGDLVKPV